MLLGEDGFDDPDADVWDGRVGPGRAELSFLTSHLVVVAHYIHKFQPDECGGPSPSCPAAIAFSTLDLGCFFLKITGLGLGIQSFLVQLGKSSQVRPAH
jgi:hypothetical protein